MFYPKSNGLSNCLFDNINQIGIYNTLCIHADYIMMKIIHINKRFHSQLCHIMSFIPKYTHSSEKAVITHLMCEAVLLRCSYNFGIMNGCQELLNGSREVWSMHKQSTSYIWWSKYLLSFCISVTDNIY